MKFKICYLLVLLLGFFTGYAQSEERDLTVEQITTAIESGQIPSGSEKLPVSTYTNAATISQTGNFNSATIMQNSTTGGNVGEIIQEGDNLSATLTQNGGDLDGAIIQKGAFHSSNLDMLGTDLDATIEQYGFGNMVEKTLQGTSKDFHLIQKGDNLRFSIQGDMLPGMTIIQQGNGMQIEVR